MTRAVAGVFIMIILTTAAFAQAPVRRTERVRLDGLIGRWNIEVVEDGVKYTMSETCDWFHGEFHVICQRQATGAGPMATLRGQKIFAFDGTDTSYTLYSINSFGSVAFMTGSVNGPVWTWQGDVRLQGQPAKARLTTTEQSPSSMAFLMEVSIGGGPWLAIESGKATKVP